MITLQEIDTLTPVYRLRMHRLSGQQQHVVHALAMVGGAGFAKNVAKRSRLTVSACSVVLGRLCSTTWPDVFAPEPATDDMLEIIEAIPRRPWCSHSGAPRPSYGRRVSYELTDKRFGVWCRALRRPSHARRLADAGRLAEL